MKIVEVDLVLDGKVAILASRPVDGARFDTASSQPHGEAKGIVIPSHLGEVAVTRDLGIGRSPEFSAQTTSV